MPITVKGRMAPKKMECVWDYPRQRNATVTSQAIPKISRVLPQTVPTLFNGSETELNFDIPQTIKGKIHDVTLVWDIKITDASGVALLPAPLFVKRTEVIGPDAKTWSTTQDADVAHDLAIFREETDWVDVYESMNFTATGGLNSTPLDASGSRLLYSPVSWYDGVLGAGFVPGAVTEPFKLKFYTRGSIALDGTTNPTVNSVYLIIQSEDVGQAKFDATVAKYQSCMYLRCPMRVRLTADFASLPGNVGTPTLMTQFTGADTAAWVVYLTDTVTTNSTVLQTYPIDTLEIQDGGGKAMWSECPTSYLKCIHATRHTKINAPVCVLSTGAQKEVYPYIFCDDLNKVLAEGKNTGGMHVIGNERLVIKPAGTLTNARLVVVAYSYAAMRFVDGHGSLLHGSF